VATDRKRKPPPLNINIGGGGGHKKNKGGGPPPLKISGSTSTRKTSGTAERTVKRMLSRAPGLRQFEAQIFSAAKIYHLDPVYLTAVLMTEDMSGNPNAQNPSGALGLGQILDGTVGNYNPRMNLVSLNGTEYHVGQAITRAMKTSPQFAISYVAWRIKGGVIKYGWPGAYTKGYNPGGPNPDRFIPKNYVPDATSAAQGSVDTTALAGATRGIVASGNNPFVTYNKKTGRIGQQIYLTKDVLMYDGVPVTKSLLQRETQDKAGIGGDYYNFTGRNPTPGIIAHIMATGKNLQEVENSWIQDTKYFKNSPAGKKYFAGYQDAWSQVMGKNQAVPWKLVQEAAASNLNETEFAARLRMDGFAGQKDNPAWSYLNSNEFQSRVDAYTTSYEKIYGETLKDPGIQNLAKDAALAGWDPTQWETYLRSRPEYTGTAEYQGHAMGILGQLGMDFGSLFGLNAKGYIPNNPETGNNIPAPPTDKRVNQGQQPTPGKNPDQAGIQVVTA
jgi:hypothetical protein